MNMNWARDWRAALPAVVFAAIIIFLAVELAFDPGPPATPTPATAATKHAVEKATPAPSTPLTAHDLGATVNGSTATVTFMLSRDAPVLVRIRDENKQVVGSRSFDAKGGAVSVEVPLKSGTSVKPGATWQLGLALTDTNGAQLPVAKKFEP